MVHRRNGMGKLALEIINSVVTIGIAVVAYYATIRMDPAQREGAIVAILVYMSLSRT
jgi:hypothetical protein